VGRQAGTHNLAAAAKRARKPSFPGPPPLPPARDQTLLLLPIRSLKSPRHVDIHGALSFSLSRRQQQQQEYHALRPALHHHLRLGLPHRRSAFQPFPPSLPPLLPSTLLGCIVLPLFLRPSLLLRRCRVGVGAMVLPPIEPPAIRPSPFVLCWRMPPGKEGGREEGKGGGKENKRTERRRIF